MDASWARADPPWSASGPGYPLFVRSARGPRFRDAEDREIIDYVMGWGASFLGYAMLQANGRAQIDVVFATLLLLAAMSVLLRASVDLVTKDLTPWAPESAR